MKPKILLVDDSKITLDHLHKIFHEEFTLLTASGGEEALKKALQQPDLILLDILMPDMDGFEVNRGLKAREETRDIPVIFLTSLESEEDEKRGLSEGAVDYIRKPFHPLIAKARIRVQIELMAKRKELHDMQDSLEKEVAERVKELRETQNETIDHLAKIIEYRDKETGLHTTRVSRYCEIIGRELEMDEESLSVFFRASQVHDLGVIGLPDSVALKKAVYLSEEYEAMKEHPKIGGKVMERCSSRLMRNAKLIAESHHEQWDGKGYPYGLKEEEIPLWGRIVSLVDAFDALTSKRPHRPPWSIPESVEYIRNHSGTKFDPRIVEAFLNVLPAITKIKEELGND